MAYLTADALKLVTEDPRVECVQANLADPSHVDRAFGPSAKYPEGIRFQLIVNLAAMSDYGQPEEIYKAYIHDLRVQCATAAAQHQCDKYIEVSTAHVYDGSSKAAKEGDTPSPWTLVAKYHLMAEQSIARIAGLNYCILRLPLVYGPADRTAIVPRLICASVYAHTRAKMEFLWGEGLRINTIHVQDVAALLWHLLCFGVVGEVYNGVDDANTTQGSLNALIEGIFDIETGYYGKLTSTLAQLKLTELVQEANDGHMEPWAEMCHDAGVSYTPLAPYLEPELLMSNHVSLDGSKVKALGFKVSCPTPTKELLEDCLRYWAKLGLFPTARADLK
jgi:dTDP-4-dehydrorhamnose reductase